MVESTRDCALETTLATDDRVCSAAVKLMVAPLDSCIRRRPALLVVLILTAVAAAAALAATLTRGLRSVGCSASPLASRVAPAVTAMSRAWLAAAGVTTAVDEVSASRLVATISASLADTVCIALEATPAMAAMASAV